MEESVRIDRDIPSRMAVIGRLVSITLKRGGTWRPGGGALLTTDAGGRNLYIVPGVSEEDFTTFRGSEGAVERMVKRFNGTHTRPTGQAVARMPDRVPERLRVKGVVKQIDYRPLEPSPKADTLWFHEAGDMGPGKANTETVLATGMDGRGAYLIVTRRDRGYPKVTSRGIVG